jgi:hypothetical protein
VLSTLPGIGNSGKFNRKIDATLDVAIRLCGLQSGIDYLHVTRIAIYFSFLYLMWNEFDHNRFIPGITYFILTILLNPIVIIPLPGWITFSISGCLLVLAFREYSIRKRLYE